VRWGGPRGEREGGRTGTKGMKGEKMVSRLEIKWGLKEKRMWALA